MKTPISPIEVYETIIFPPFNGTIGANHETNETIILWNHHLIAAFVKNPMKPSFSPHWKQEMENANAWVRGTTSWCGEEWNYKVGPPFTIAELVYAYLQQLLWFINVYESYYS